MDKFKIFVHLYFRSTILWSKSLSVCCHVILDDDSTPKHVGCLINKYVLIVYFVGISCSIVVKW